MEARNIPHFGEPVLIQELAVPSQWMHKSVSITGRLSTLSTGGLTESKQNKTNYLDLGSFLAQSSQKS